MNGFEKSLTQKINREIPDLEAYTPGMIIDVHVRGRRRGLIHMGKTYDYYDLASLTKIIFTASASMHYFSLNPQKLFTPSQLELSGWRSCPTPFQLLTHNAGLDWWKPYYKKLTGPMEPQLRWNQLKKLLAKSKASRRQTALYSDLDIWYMGAYLESALQMSLLEIWQMTADRIQIKDIFFHPKNRPRYPRSRYAPTENCPWRGHVLRGEVHDENTWSLGGVAPHAGLFGSVEAVSDWGLQLRQARLNRNRRFGDPKMVEKFVRRQTPRRVGDWGLGFMKPSLKGASCGRRFSARSFGHTGFTGTSLWMDPVVDVMVVILSNRVHPTRTNEKFKSLRGPIHDWICELLSV